MSKEVVMRIFSPYRTVPYIAVEYDTHNEIECNKLYYKTIRYSEARHYTG